MHIIFLNYKLDQILKLIALFSGIKGYKGCEKGINIGLLGWEFILFCSFEGVIMQYFFDSD